MKLIKDSQNRICLLGEATSVTEEWLGLQTIPFNQGAVFHSAYPVTGGAVVVDVNDVTNLGEASTEMIDDACTGYGFNPAADTIRKLATT